MKKFILLNLTMCLICAGIEIRADGSAGFSRNPEDSMIQLFEEESDQIVISQMPFDFSLPSFGIGSGMNEDLAPLLRPPFLQEYFDRIGEDAPFHSSRVIEETSINIPEGVLLRIEPEIKKSVESWSAKVINSRGAVIREFKGEGNPPGTIQWDGTEDGWTRIQAGEAYNFVFDGVNKDGSHSHESGTPVKFPYFSVVQNKSPAIMIARAELFNNTGPVALSDQGRSLMTAVCEILTRFPSQPVVLNVVAAELARAQNEAAFLKEFVSKVLLRNPEELTADIQIDPNETEQVKVQVLGVEK